MRVTKRYPRRFPHPTPHGATSASGGVSCCCLTTTPSKTPGALTPSQGSPCALAQVTTRGGGQQQTHSPFSHQATWCCLELGVTAIPGQGPGAPASNPSSGGGTSGGDPTQVGSDSNSWAGTWSPCFQPLLRRWDFRWRPHPSWFQACQKHHPITEASLLSH